MKVLVIGLGQIGYHTAEYMTAQGLEVHGFDIYKPAMDHALRDGVISKKTPDFTGYDYYIICVSTHNPKDITKPYIDGLMEVINKIKAQADPGALVCIDSTVPAGTARRIAELIHPKICVIHCPHRFYIHEKADHGIGQLRVLAGYRECCVEKGYDFYHAKAGIDVHVASSLEIAELSKLVENSHRYIEIAFAEELRMYCDAMGVDFTELRKAANTKWNCNIMEARDGIGLHCLPKDSIMLAELISADSCLIKTAHDVDRNYRKHISPLPEIER